jgi:hypothetical protein
MDWPLREADFCDEDLDNVFLYQTRRSKAVYRFADDQGRNTVPISTLSAILTDFQEMSECWLETDLEAARWLEEVYSLQ